jgi:integrase
MSKPNAPLTQADIAKLSTPPHRKAIQVPVDPQVPGLLVEVRHTGSKSFFLRYRDADGATRYHKVARSMDLSLSAIKKEALRLRSGIVLKQWPGADKVVKTQCMTFAEFFEQKYLPFARPRKRSWRDDEKLYNRRLKTLFGDTPLDKITRHSLQQMHSDLRSELSASSCDHHLGLMSRCLRLALDWKLITENPAQGLKKYNEDNRRDRLMTDEELQRLMAVLDNDPARTACLALKMALLTAARKGEILSMKWSDINRQTSVWTLPAISAKGKRRRAIPISSGALAILEELSNNNNSEFVFENSRKPGERLKSIDKVWQRVRGKAQLPPDIVIHSLRHHAGSALIRSGVDLSVVRDLMGHRSISTTQLYLHSTGESLHEGAEKLETYLDKALKKKGSPGK